MVVVMKTTKPEVKPLALIGAKVPHEIKDAIQRRATEEERTVSQTVARLLASHPALKIKRTKAEVPA
jgi:hypothetical protein